jgi:hypothetical protein
MFSPAPPVDPERRFYTLFFTQERARALRIGEDIFHDKNVITRPRGRCNVRAAAAELK